MGRIAILGLFEYEYRDAEYEYEKKHEQCGAPKSPPMLFLFFESWSTVTSVTTCRSSEESLRCAMNEPSDIPEHESPLRRMMADAQGISFQPLRSLDDAIKHDDGVAILQGDWGGQIYAVVPARMIRCSSESLKNLLMALDSEAWSCNDNEGASIYYERKPIGMGVGGGMGGGASTGELWIHPEFDSIADDVRRVILGELNSLPVS